MIELIIHDRINYHLHREKFWSEKQYGFKQGISTEHALENLLKTKKKVEIRNIEHSQ